MKHTTSSKPIAIDSVPLLIESAPKDAPTVLSSAIVTGTGKAVSYTHLTLPTTVFV